MNRIAAAPLLPPDPLEPARSQQASTAIIALVAFGALVVGLRWERRGEGRPHGRL